MVCKKILTISFLFFLISFAFAFNHGSAGTEGDPFQIEFIEDLNSIKSYASDGYYFLLKNDLNFLDEDSYSDSGNMGDYEEWIPIQDFNGFFDGNNYLIYDMVISQGGVDNVGFFSKMIGGVIENLHLKNIDVVGRNYVGGLIGDMSGSNELINVSTHGEVRGASSTGGLVGRSVAQISGQSYADVNVYSSGGDVGGLVGLMNGGQLYGVYATGNIINSSNGTWSQRFGGLVGNFNVGSINQCYATGDVRNYYGMVGGLVGQTALYREISNSYATGDVSVMVSNMQRGGLVGRCQRCTITKSYATSLVSTNGSAGGGLVGGIYTPVTDTNNFWDVNTSNYLTSAMGTGLTTTEMMDFNSFNNANWDIVLIGDYDNETWFIDDGEDYPRLWFEFVEDEEPPSDPCNPTINEDWTISELIECTSKSIDIGTGKIVFENNGILKLFSSNVTLSLIEFVSGSQIHLDSGSWVKIEG